MNTTPVTIRPSAGDTPRGSFWAAGMLAGAATMYVGGALLTTGSHVGPASGIGDAVPPVTSVPGASLAGVGPSRPSPELVAKVRLAALASALPANGASMAAPTTVWDDLARCESSGNWSINSGNGFHGGLQFTASTWRAFGGARYAESAEQASRTEQIAVAQQVQAKQGWGAWPVCSKRVNAASKARAQPPQPSAHPLNPTAPAGPGAVVVRPGESLFTIAADHHVDGGWQALFELNKTRLRDPNVIHAGERLDLPAPSGRPGAERQPDSQTPSAVVHDEPGHGDHDADGARRGDDRGRRANPLILTGPTQQQRAWVTGHTWTPTKKNKNANKLGDPVVHEEPGGVGTYDDPISASVPPGADRVWKVGARFYLPTLKRYVVVEDTGATTPPSDQEGHLDVWLGQRTSGRGKDKTAVDQCLDRVNQDNVPVELNPPAGRPVTPGPLLRDQTCQVPTHR